MSRKEPTQMQVMQLVWTIYVSFGTFQRYKSGHVRLESQEYYIQVMKYFKQSNPTKFPLPEFPHRLQLKSQLLSGPSGSAAPVLHSARGSEDSIGRPSGGSVAPRGCVGSQQVVLPSGGLAVATRRKAQRPAGKTRGPGVAGISKSLTPLL